jgi:hypothetical protein
MNSKDYIKKINDDIEIILNTSSDTISELILRGEKLKTITAKSDHLVESTNRLFSKFREESECGIIKNSLLSFIKLIKYPFYLVKYTISVFIMLFIKYTAYLFPTNDEIQTLLLKNKSKRK